MRIPDVFKKPIVQRTAKIAGYVVFGLFVFIISVVLTLPASRFRSLLEAKLSQNGVVVHIGDLTVSGFSTLAAKDVEVNFPPEVHVAPDGQEIRTPRVVRLDELSVGLNPWRLLFGGLSLRLWARSGGGEIGPIRVGAKDGLLDVNIEKVQDFPIPKTLPIFGISFSGKVGGKARLAIDTKQGFGLRSGRVELWAREVTAHSPTLRSRTYGEAKLTDVKLGEVALALNIDAPENIPALAKGKSMAKGVKDSLVAHFEKAEVNGEDIKVILEPQSLIRFVQGRAQDAQVAIDLAFALSDAFYEREVKSGGKLEKPNKFLKTLLDADPRWRSAAVGGYYGVVCSGPLRAPNCIPKRPAIRGGEFKKQDKPVEEAPARVEEVRKEAPTKPVPAQPVEPARPAVQFSQPPAPVPQQTPAGAAENLGVVQPPVSPPQPPAAVPTQVPAAGREAVEAVRKLTPTIIGRSRLQRGVEAQVEPSGEAEGQPGGGQPSNEEVQEE